MKAEVWCQATFAVGEGPLWHAGALWWVDIPGGTIQRFDGKHLVSMPCGPFPSAVAPCEDGRLLVARQDGVHLLDWESKAVGPLPTGATPEAGHRFNDGKCDALGRFWCGTMALGAITPTGRLYRMSAAQPPACVLDGLRISNGMAWSHDASRMFFVDSPERAVVVFDFELESGAIFNKRVLAAFPERHGVPDGMCIDEEDNLWVAFWGGSCVRRLDGTSGRELATLPIPTSQPSSCCFGEGRSLYVTSARARLSPATLEREPLAGATFLAEAPVGGPQASAFKPL